LHNQRRKALPAMSVSTEPAICRFPRRQRTTLPIKRMARLTRIPKVVGKTFRVYRQDGLDGTTGLRDGRLGFRIPLGLRYFLLYSKFGPASDPFRLLFDRQRGERPEREVDQPPPSSAKDTNEWSSISSPPIRPHGVDLDSFSFILEPPPVPTHYTQFDKESFNSPISQFTKSPNIIIKQIEFRTA
jgi:hypothetical protein